MTTHTQIGSLRARPQLCSRSDPISINVKPHSSILQAASMVLLRFPIVTETKSSFVSHTITPHMVKCLKYLFSSDREWKRPFVKTMWPSVHQNSNTYIKVFSINRIQYLRYWEQILHIPISFPRMLHQIKTKCLSQNCDYFLMKLLWIQIVNTHFISAEQRRESQSFIKGPPFRGFL